jgi:Tol biopolymer transport system component
MKPDGSDSHPVGPLATPYFNPASEPAWSPGAIRILYQVGCEIWVMKANGSHSHRLIQTQRAFGCNGEPAWPQWSPSGKRIVYVGRGPLTASNFVRIANADGSHDHLVPNTADAESAFFSPDGRYIVFVNQPPDAQTYSPRIYLIRTNGTGLERISPPGQDATNPSWSPDGTRIIYACSIYGNVILIPSPRPTGRNAPPVVNPSHPPHSHPGPHAICEISRAHPKPRKLYSVPSDGALSDPVWSADGKTILVMVFDPNGFHVALLAPSGRTRSEFTPAGPFSNPDW